MCALHNQTGRPEKALALVNSRRFQPWEGGEGGPLGQWVRSHLALGRAALRQATTKHRDSTAHRRLITSAIAHFQQAAMAPNNLGEARHLLANASDLHYWLGCALDELGETDKAREHWREAATFQGDFQEMSVRAFSEMTYYSALAWRKLGEPLKAKALFQELLAYARSLRKTKAKIDYFATSLPTLLLFEDDLQFRQETTAWFLEAQAQLGLGRAARAQRLLRLVLQRDPGHAPASDLTRELSNHSLSTSSRSSIWRATGRAGWASANRSSNRRAPAGRVDNNQDARARHRA
jgi:tetratricopeptide (TPR) repeat protein